MQLPIKADTQLPGQMKHTYKQILQHYRFCYYLVEGRKSPLCPSLDKLALGHDRWRQILSWPFSYDASTTHDLAIEAEQMARSSGKMADHDMSLEFDKQIDDSLASGDSWLHKWCKNESPTIHVITSHIKVSNLPPGVHYDQLVRHLESCGEIQSMQLVEGVASVHFKNEKGSSRSFGIASNHVGRL